MTHDDSGPPDAINARVVRKIAKGTREELRVSALELPDGRKFGDVRLFARNAGAGGEIKPTKKGVTFSPELLAELRRGLSELEDFFHAR